MEFDKKLVSKILDPIHGIIRLTDLELSFIDHPLFQRLRTIKQNTFLYKVFPSAMHTRFEHSLGVMNLSYEILKHLQINSFRFTKKNSDTSYVFQSVEHLPLANIQELRLAALMHDIGHGPMSHQFDSFLPDNRSFKSSLGDQFPELFEMVGEEGIEHEHISLIFVKVIYDSLTEKEQLEINIDNVMMIIESKYLHRSIPIEIETQKIDILPMLTSIISSCPIDADRMDYLQRDGYFSGVKCGIYDFNRLFMSIVPVVETGKLYLAYTESCIDSIAEFISARSNLFSQVYYHKTNRAFSVMLDSICKAAKKDNSNDIFNNYNEEHKSNYIENITSFYLTNSDSYFLDTQLPKLIANCKKPIPAKEILEDLKNRKPWIKKYESKIYPKDLNITNKINKSSINLLKSEIVEILSSKVNDIYFSVDVMTDNAFKDIDKTEIKLLTKNYMSEYKLNRFDQCGDKLNKHQSIKCFIRVFIDPRFQSKINSKTLQRIENCKIDFLKSHSLIS